MSKLKGIDRYLKPKLFPIYGILAGYLIILIFRYLFDRKLYEIIAFYINTHGVTIADILLISGFIGGVIFWRSKTRG